VEQEIRAAVAELRPGHVITAAQLADRLGVDEKQVTVWLDLLASEGVLNAEHRIIAEAERGEPVMQYRVPI
jgi:predicted ArsR family transcriptional regulator